MLHTASMYVASLATWDFPAAKRTCLFEFQYLLTGSSNLRGPSVSGHRGKTSWLLGYRENPPALISEEETDEEDDAGKEV